MCVAMMFGEKEISVKNGFTGNNRTKVLGGAGVLALNQAIRINSEIYWDGWVKKEDKPDWKAKGWQRAEVFASKFNQMGRWYDVPPGEIINGIVFYREGTAILKIVTREAVGLEQDVQPRFADTGPRQLVEMG